MTEAHAGREVPGQEPAAQPADQIERLAELRELGILTEEEFAAEQKKLLGD